MTDAPLSTMLPHELEDERVRVLAEYQANTQNVTGRSAWKRLREIHEEKQRRNARQTRIP